MFPIRDHNPSSRRPYVTWALMSANLLAFLLSWPLFGDTPPLQYLFADGAFTPSKISNGYNFVTLISYMFLHAGVLHLAGNMLFLWIFGNNLEDQLGRVRYLLFYIAAGVCAALTHFWSDIASQAPMVGASGAIAGVMGGYMLLFPNARVDILMILVIVVRIIALPAWLVLGAWFGLQVFGSWVTLDDLAVEIAFFAHAGGFLAGICLAMPWFLARGGTAYWCKNGGKPPYPEVITGWRRTPIPVVERQNGSADDIP